MLNPLGIAEQEKNPLPSRQCEHWLAMTGDGHGVASSPLWDVPHVGGRCRPRNERRPPTFPLPTRAAGASAAPASGRGFEGGRGDQHPPADQHPASARPDCGGGWGRASRTAATWHPLRLAERSLGLEITDSAKSLIIERGFDPLYGARPLRRYLQSSVETLIARRILAGDVAPESTIVVDVENGELICR